MKNPEKLKELILEKLDFADVMLEYGVKFIYDPRIADEVQFRCPFHGRDNKPSARYYRYTQSSFCWVCKKRWDVISFIRDKEKLSFERALSYIINKYKIDDSGIPEDLESIFVKPKSDNQIHLREKILLHNLKKNIKDLKGKIGFDKYNALCWSWNIISFTYSNKLDISESLKKLEEKINKARLG